VDKSWEELQLPPGYRLEWDLDMLILRRPDGSAVATFSARGAMPERVEEEAWEDAARDRGGDDPGPPEPP
jgi:hypothetical protein